MSSESVAACRVRDGPLAFRAPTVEYSPIGRRDTTTKHARRESSRIMSVAPTVTIHVFGQLRSYCGGASQLSVSARTVGAALDALEQSQPTLYRNVCDETGVVRRHLNVFVNADHVRDLDGVGTALAPGDVVTFLPAVSGG